MFSVLFCFVLKTKTAEIIHSPAKETLQEQEEEGRPLTCDTVDLELLSQGGSLSTPLTREPHSCLGFSSRLDWHCINQSFLYLFPLPHVSLADRDNLVSFVWIIKGLF
jgi:hypothetical protein